MSPYAGKRLKPREVADRASHRWTGVNLVKATATFLGESGGSVGAWHDNEGADGKLLSRDCGLAQINIPASKVGTEYEAKLRTDSLDPAVYEPVIAENLRRARELYDTPWIRGGKKDKRRWQPWYAYTQGWATFPEWWIWARPALDSWKPTGRYIQKAVLGIANFRLLIAKAVTPERALEIAQGYADIFKIEGELGIRPSGIAWVHIPAKPSAPPPDGIGPRPTPNDGT